MKKIKFLSTVLAMTFFCNSVIQITNTRDVFAAENDKFITEKTITQISDKPNEEEFEIEIRAKKKPEVKVERKIDLSIAFDNSASLGSANPNDKVFFSAKESVKSMINGLDKNVDRVSLTPYKGSNRTFQGEKLEYAVDTKVSMTNDFSLVESEIDAMTLAGETPMYSGVKNAIADLENNARGEAKKKLVIVSDGEPNVSKPIVTASDTPIGMVEPPEDAEDPFSPIYDGKKKYDKYLYEYRYAQATDKAPDGDAQEYGEDSFYYTFGGDVYRTPDFRIARKAMPFYEGGFDFLREEVKAQVEQAKNNGVEVYVVYIQRYNTQDPRYALDENLFKKTSVNFMQSLATDSNKFFTVDGLDSLNQLDSIFKQIKEDIKPQNHLITDEVIDKFEVVPNSFKAEVDGVDMTSEIIPVQSGNKLEWIFKDDAREEYELILKYRIKRALGTKGGTYITSLKPAELVYNDNTINGVVEQKLEFNQVQAVLKSFGELRVRYVDEKTQKYIDSEYKEVKEVGEEYVTVPKSINGYKVSKIPQNAKGKYIDGLTEVVYYYTKELEKVISGGNSNTVTYGTVTVKYIDKATNKEIAPITFSKKEIGTDYVVEPKVIEGYEVLERPLKENGKYINGNIELVYFYGENIDIKDEETPKGNLAAKKGTVVVKYLEKGTDKELASYVKIDDIVGNEYLANALNIEGYELLDIPLNEKGKYVDGIIEVVYYYGKQIRIEDEVTPKGQPTINQKFNENVSKDKYEVKLPKTGEESSAPYYCIGIILVVIGCFLRKKF